MSLFVFRATLAHTMPRTVAEMTADHPLSAIYFLYIKDCRQREKQRESLTLSLSLHSPLPAGEAKTPPQPLGRPSPTLPGVARLTTNPRLPTGAESMKMTLPVETEKAIRKLEQVTGEHAEMCAVAAKNVRDAFAAGHKIVAIVATKTDDSSIIRMRVVGYYTASDARYHREHLFRNEQIVQLFYGEGARDAAELEAAGLAPTGEINTIH